MGAVNNFGNNNYFLIFRYSGERVAQLTCSVNLDLPNEATVVGTKGALKLPGPFWCPTKLETPSVCVCHCVCKLRLAVNGSA